MEVGGRDGETRLGDERGRSGFYRRPGRVQAVRMNFEPGQDTATVQSAGVSPHDVRVTCLPYWANAMGGKSRASDLPTWAERCHNGLACSLLLIDPVGHLSHNDDDPQTQAQLLPAGFPVLMGSLATDTASAQRIERTTVSTDGMAFSARHEDIRRRASRTRRRHNQVQRLHEANSAQRHIGAFR